MKLSSLTTLWAALGAGLAVLGWLQFSPRADSGARPEAEQKRMVVVDDLGRTVDLPHPVRRVVVLNRFVAELIRAVGAETAIIGMSGNAGRVDPEYWPRFDAAKLVGVAAQETDYERVVALHPDVVIGEGIGNWRRHVQKLEPFGIPYVAVEGAWNQKVHAQSIRLLGRMLDKPEGTTRLLAYHEGMKQMLAERLGSIEQRKTVYYESHGQKSAYVTALPGSGWHDMVVTGGGINLFGDTRIADYHGQGDVHGVAVDPEAILLRNPDAVIKIEPGVDRSFRPATRAELIGTFEWLLARPGWERVTAVRDDRVLVIDDFAANLSGKVLGSVYIAKLLYPDRFRDIDPDDLLRTWFEEFQQVAYPGAYHYPALQGQH